MVRAERPRNDVIGTPACGRVIALLDPLTELPVGQGEPGVLMVRVSSMHMSEGILSDAFSRLKVPSGIGRGRALGCPHA